MIRISAFIMILFLTNDLLLSQADQTYLRSIDPHASTTGLPIFDNSNNAIQIGKNVFVESGHINQNNRRETRLLKIPLDTTLTFEQIAINGPQGDISISQGVKSTDNGLLYTGEWVDYNQGLMRTFLVKYDTALNVLWMNTFPELEDPDRVYYGTDICMTKEGEILSYGSCGVYDQSKQIASVAYILKTDSLGKLLWYKELDDDFIETLAYGNLTPTSDGNYLFSTLARYPLPTGNWMRVYYQYVKINGDGDVLWKKVLIDVPNDNQLPFTTATVDGGFVAAMQKDTFLADKGFGPFRNLRWYDQNEVLKKEYHWNNWSYRYSTNDLLTTQNGEIISVGIVVTDAGRGQSFIERYSPEGELIWERIYNDSLARPWPGAFLAFVSVTELDDHRIAITGIVTDSVDTVTNPNWPPLNFNVLFVVLDSLGCLEPGCDGVLQVITSLEDFQELAPLDVPLLRMAPNPASDHVVVQLSEQSRSHLDRGVLTCYNLQGRVVQTWSWPQSNSNQMDLNLTGLSMGSYYLVLTNGGYPVGSGKLIIKR